MTISATRSLRLTARIPRLTSLFYTIKPIAIIGSRYRTLKHIEIIYATITLTTIFSPLTVSCSQIWRVSIRYTDTHTAVNVLFSPWMYPLLLDPGKGH